MDTENGLTAVRREEFGGLGEKGEGLSKKERKERNGQNSESDEKNEKAAPRFSKCGTSSFLKAISV